MPSCLSVISCVHVGPAGGEPHQEDGAVGQIGCWYMLALGTLERRLCFDSRRSQGGGGFLAEGHVQQTTLPCELVLTAMNEWRHECVEVHLTNIAIFFVSLQFPCMILRCSSCVQFDIQSVFFVFPVFLFR